MVLGKEEKEILDNLLSKNNKDASPDDIHSAVKRVNGVKIRHWLTHVKGVINSKDEKGNTPLHLACELKDHPEIARILLEWPGTDVNAINSLGETPLQIVCKRGDAETLSLLLDHHSTRIREIDEQGNTPLHHAVTNVDSDVVQKLIERDSTMINAVNKREETPLHVACLHGNGDAVSLLLKVPEIRINMGDMYGDTPLHIACTNDNHQDVVAILVADPYININVINNNRETPLHVACENGCVIAVSVLVEEASLDVNSKNIDGNTPLHLACMLKEPDIAKMLLDRADLKLTYTKDDIQNLKLTKEQVRERDLCNDGNWEPIQVALELRRVRILRTLLDDKRIDVNQMFRRGTTLLHMACANDDGEAIEIIIDHTGLDLRVKDERIGNTAFTLACETGSLSAVKALMSDLNFGSILNEPVEFTGKTGLHIACERGNEELVGILLKRTDVKANLPDGNMDTPLLIAAKKKFYEVVELLIRSGREIDLDAKDINGMSTLDRAIKDEDPLLLALISIHENFQHRWTNITGFKNEEFRDVCWCTTWRNYIDEMEELIEKHKISLRTVFEPVILTAEHLIHLRDQRVRARMNGYYSDDDREYRGEKIKRPRARTPLSATLESSGGTPTKKKRITTPHSEDLNVYFPSRFNELNLKTPPHLKNYQQRELGVHTPPKQRTPDEEYYTPYEKQISPKNWSSFRPFRVPSFQEAQGNDFNPEVPQGESSHTPIDSAPKEQPQATPRSSQTHYADKKSGTSQAASSTLMGTIPTQIKSDTAYYDYLLDHIEEKSQPSSHYKREDNYRSKTSYSDSSEY